MSLGHFFVVGLDSVVQLDAIPKDIGGGEDRFEGDTTNAVFVHSTQKGI